MYSADKGEENRAPCYNVDWDFEKLYSEAVGRKEGKKIIISFKKKEKVQPLQSYSTFSGGDHGF